MLRQASSTAASPDMPAARKPEAGSVCVASAVCEVLCVLAGEGGGPRATEAFDFAGSRSSAPRPAPASTFDCSK